MSRTILLADDSVTIQKVIELTFMDEDYTVVAVGDGDEALEQLDRLTPDVVIADVHMPGASGYDVCRHAKSRHGGVPVLLLVGTFEPFDEEEAERAAADRHLKKPFDSQELQRVVEELLASAPGAGSAPGTSPAAPEAEETVPPASGSFGLSDAPAARAAGGASHLADPLDETSAPFFLGLDDDGPAPSQVMPPPAAEAGSESRWGSQGEPAVADEPLAAVAEPERAAPPTAEPEDDGESYALEDAEASEPAPSAPSASTGDAATAGTGLSDQDVDRIARRIVELLGDDAVREVAWEVIPDMAEVVVRDRLRELEAQVE